VSDGCGLVCVCKVDLMYDIYIYIECVCKRERERDPWKHWESSGND